MAYEFSRNRKDADFIVTKANASAGANSTAIDLEQIVGGDIEAVAFELALPAEALLSDAKTLTFVLKDSADNSTFAVLDPTIGTTQLGAGGVGCAAKTVRFRLPPGCRRYIRIEQTVTATPGTLSGSFTLSALF